MCKRIKRRVRNKGDRIQIGADLFQIGAGITNWCRTDVIYSQIFMKMNRREVNLHCTKNEVFQ